MAPSVRTIVGVSTSLTVFLGRAERGPVGKPVRVSSVAEYEGTFGGRLDDSPMPWSVQDFFLNGGGQAVIIRLFENDAAAHTALLAPPPPSGGSPAPAPRLVASSPGTWGTRLGYTTDTRDLAQDSERFNLTVTYQRPDGTTDSESFQAVSLHPDAGPRRLDVLLEQSSKYVRLASTGGAPGVLPDVDTHNAGVQDSAKLSEATYLKGLELLDSLDVYNIVCIPSDSFDGRHDIPANVYGAAATRCGDERATLLLDPPSSWARPGDIHPETFSALFGYGQDSDLAPFSALYFPRIRSPDPRRPEALLTRPPCGLLAGILARTDATLGVWKAPTGLKAGLVGITDLACTLEDEDNGRLTAMAVNCLRSFPSSGPVVWGARTLAGVDALGNDFKFLPMRRLTSYIEQTLLRQLRWTLFEPNGEPLWAQLRQAIGAFMNDLFRQGAFQGSSSNEAFFVTCDATTTSQDDIARGIVNIEVGFAPLRPAEFLVLRIEQPAGQSS